MARRTIKTLAQKMAVSGKEPAKDILDDTDLADDPIISAIQSLRAVVDDLQHNDSDDESRDLTSAINTNSAKTGISTSQASAITANTSKTGISTSQASAITANTSKTGITSTQAGHITANNAKVGTETDLSVTEGMVLKATVAVSRGVYTLTFTVTHDRVTKTANITMS